MQMRKLTVKRAIGAHLIIISKVIRNEAGILVVYVIRMEFFGSN